MKQKSIKEAILIAYTKRERLYIHLFRLAISLVGFLVINDSYGFMGAISGIWLPIALGVLCAFLPVNITAFVMFVYLSIHLYALSLDVCLVFVGLCLLMYLIARAFGSDSMIHIIYMSVLYRLSAPFLAPLYEGCFGKKKEIATMIGGTVIAFYLRLIRISAAGIKNDENQSAFTIIRDNMLSNPMFYLLLIAIAAMFIIVYIVRRLRIKHAWTYAVIFGTVVEVVIMVSGYLLTGNGSRVPVLIIGSVVTLAVGLVFAFFFEDTKLSRQRLLDFEDDEFYYHVVCTPKLRIQIEESDKRIKRITRSKKEIDKEEPPKDGPEDAPDKEKAEDN